MTREPLLSVLPNFLNPGPGTFGTRRVSEAGRSPRTTAGGFGQDPGDAKIVNENIAGNGEAKGNESPKRSIGDFSRVTKRAGGARR